MEPRAICGLLAETDRLRVFSAVVLGTSTIPAIAAQTGLAEPAIGTAVRKLTGAGLLELDADGRLTAAVDRFKTAMRDTAPTTAPGEYHPDPKRDALLRSVLRSGRIDRMPTAPAKVRVVLEYLAARFEPGVEYPEPEVNALLNRYHDDHATLRRYLVDHGLLARSAGRYRRVRD